MACVFRVMSATSSRNRVPPSASSNFPFLAESAPVKAPRVCPNSSLSISSSGMAAQFTSTKGPEARRLWKWMLRATSSLPVPFSPKIITRPLEGAACEMSERSAWIAALSPTITHRCWTCSLSARFSASSRRSRSAFLTTVSVFSSESGFSTKSCAPMRTALTAVSMLPCPEITTTGTSGSRVRTRASVSRPSIFGSHTSRRSRSKRRPSRRVSAASPRSTASTWYPSSPRIPVSEARTPASSSTTKIDSRIQILIHDSCG